MKAMHHKVTGGTPVGWTPLHMLLSGSDCMMAQMDIVQTLLENDVVPLQYFDGLRNDEVIVLIHQFGYV